MNKHEIIERLLKAQRGGQWNMSSAFGGAVGANNTGHVMQADMNKAMEAWLQGNDPTGIQQIVGTMHVTGALTDADYEQIMKAIDGES